MRSWLRPDGRRFVFGDPDADLPAGDLHATADEADAERLVALERLGFVLHRRQLELMLPADAPAVVAPPGLRALRADEVQEERLRLLDDELRQDVPGTDGWRWQADDFHAETYQSPHFDPAVYLVATTADGDHVGICRVWLRPEHPKLGFIGVRRSLRRRGIARWLIGETFAVLHARGEREVWTELDETNVASRTLLERLGGRPVGASLELIRPSSAGFRRPSEPRPSPGDGRPPAPGAPRSRT
jgi:ribosomal protein S18 acetylase RimI-like enzyme